MVVVDLFDINGPARFWHVVVSAFTMHTDVGFDLVDLNEDVLAWLNQHASGFEYEQHVGLVSRTTQPTPTEVRREWLRVINRACLVFHNTQDAMLFRLTWSCTA